MNQLYKQYPRDSRKSFGGYNLVGERFGNVTVVSLLDERYQALKGKPQRRWLCLCDCGKSTIQTSNNLLMGHISSCGCSHYKKQSQETIQKRVSKMIKKDSGLKETYSSYRRQAIKRGFVFDLSLEQAQELFTQDCHYCGREPSSKYRKSAIPFIYSGIDRKNNSIGYTLENSVSCCAICNRMKVDINYDEFLYLVKSIYEKRIKKNK